MGKTRYRGEQLGLNRIFKMLESGVPNRDIVDAIDRSAAHYKDSRAKGEQSELNVLRSLRKLWYVTEVTRIGKKNADHDHESHDLKVALDAISCLSILEIGLQIPNNFVFVEVKSSEAGINRYHDRTIFNMDLKDTAEYESLMKKKKTIIVNGQANDEGIQTSFLEQLISMNIAWAENIH